MPLTIKDLKEVAEFLSKVQSKWYDIGLELKISTELLDAIKDHWGDDHSQCMLEMLKPWLNSADPLPTWKTIASALKNTAITDSDEEGITIIILIW